MILEMVYKHAVHNYYEYPSYLSVVGVVEWGYEEVCQVHLDFLVQIEHGEQWYPWSSDSMADVPFTPQQPPT